MSRHPWTLARSLAARPGSPAQAWRVWALLVLMLAFQGLGQSHRVLHGAGFARTLVPLASLTSAMPPLVGPQALAASAASVDAWGHSRGELICLLLDQLSHDHAPVAWPALALPDAAHAIPVGARVASLPLVARWERAARGPPALA